MLSESDAACYPVCESCRVAGVCTAPKLPPVKVPKPARFKSPNEYNLIPAECGCRLVPVPILVIAKKENVICDIHGITRLRKEKPSKAKRNTGKPQIPGQREIDIPPY